MGSPTLGKYDGTGGETRRAHDQFSVSSAIVQRYMDPILDAALSQHPQTQSAAVDILSFTIKQGLAHPLQSFPVIVALETSPNTALSARASALHSALNSKHASLLNSRYIISARASFSYQVKLAQARGGSGAVEGARGGTALLHRWFALAREKRGPKLEFLKALVRAFDVSTSLATAQEDIDFARYMAENFAAFDYKTQEEVLLVVKSLTNVLSTAGMQCIEALSPGYLLAQLQAPIGQQPLRTQADGTEASVPDATTTADPAEQGSTLLE
jgi:cohesin loading factor subunit SCC2